MPKRKVIVEATIKIAILVKIDYDEQRYDAYLKANDKAKKMLDDDKVKLISWENGRIYENKES